MENDAECPTCAQENQKILQKINFKKNLMGEDAFKGQLEKSTDGFGTMIDMLSRGEIVVQDKSTKKPSTAQEDLFDKVTPASNKLLANRARIANDKKFGRVSDLTSSPKRSPVDVVRQKIEMQKADEKKKTRKTIITDNPFETGEIPKAAINPFGEEPSSSDVIIP